MLCPNGVRCDTLIVGCGALRGWSPCSGSMALKTLLDDAGRMELPDFVQAQLGVKPGDELALEEENGKWFIKPAALSLPSSTADTDDDDLNWQDLDYHPVPLKRAKQVAVQIEHRGKLQPMAHDLDEE